MSETLNEWGKNQVWVKNCMNEWSSEWVCQWQWVIEGGRNCVSEQVVVWKPVSVSGHKKTHSHSHAVHFVMSLVVLAAQELWRTELKTTKVSDANIAVYHNVEDSGANSVNISHWRVHFLSVCPPALFQHSAQWNACDTQRGMWVLYTNPYVIAVKWAVQI